MYTLVALSITLFVTAYLLSFKHTFRQKRHAHAQEPKDAQKHDISIHKTQIIKSNISHYRLFPKRHGFNYSYLSVGIPVRSPISNWLISVDERKWWKRGWLHVTEKDYLHRTINDGSLSQKLDAYLKKQDIDPADLPHVFLLTSARFLNYKFSPASFWYLYTSNLVLKYVIAEVNNTFGERRMYLFPAPESSGSFKQTLLKDFHVSPFSSRKGWYVLETTDPIKTKNISVTVTLHSSKGNPKLVARWQSIACAIDARHYSVLSSLGLLSCWGWTVLVTFPRIVFQSVLLAQLHRLSIWYRPEPKETAEPRQGTLTETIIASVTTHYLDFLQHEDQHVERIKLVIRPGIFRQRIEPCERRDSKRHTPAGSQQSILELRVQTPQFYRQVITYNCLTDYLRHTLLHPNEENRTAWASDSIRLIDYLEDLERAMRDKLRGEQTDKAMPRVLLTVYYWLRTTEPLTGSYPDPGLPKARAVPIEARVRAKFDGPRKEWFLDEFVFGHCNTWLQIRYVWATLSLQWRTRVMGMIGGE